MKLTLRATTEDGHVLGWVEAEPLLRGDQRIRVPGDRVTIPIAEAGTVTDVVAHWCDLHVAAWHHLDPPVHLVVGGLLTVPFPAGVLVFQTDPRPLDGLVVGQAVTVGPPVGVVVALTP